MIDDTHVMISRGQLITFALPRIFILCIDPTTYILSYHDHPINSS